MSYAFVFPGQGSQSIGMGKRLFETYPLAKEIFEEVDETLEQFLYNLMSVGDLNELTLTENAQPALMAVSLAVIRVLEKEGNFSISQKASYVAGHSLGEYSALAAAGSFTLADTAKLLKKRGLAMQQAVPVGKGGMAAILGLTLKEVEEIVKKVQEQKPDQICSIANDNAPGQVVISGDVEAIEYALSVFVTEKKAKGIKLPVSAPFHCTLMKPAAHIMDEALSKTTIESPILPLISNVTAQKVNDVTNIRSLLVKQITERVRWCESILYMKKLGVTTIIECGAGKVLAGLIKRIDKELEVISVGDPEGIDNVLKKIC
ncbi:MAG: ACP S-malonyltransferase [Alphaproteobacteria bacterium]|nr:ACP S-malonyltransferase [Alphaproteobacteria bacterium]